MGQEVSEPSAALFYGRHLFACAAPYDLQQMPFDRRGLDVAHLLHPKRRMVRAAVWRLRRFVRSFRHYLTIYCYLLPYYPPTGVVALTRICFPFPGRYRYHGRVLVFISATAF